MLLIQRIFNFDISQDMRKAFVLFFFFIKPVSGRKVFFFGIFFFFKSNQIYNVYRRRQIFELVQ